MKKEILPFLPVAEPDLGPLEERYLLEAYRSGWISSLGDFVGRFERNFAAFGEVGYAVAVSNGTAALHLALLAAGVGPGDEVIVPALTFAATAAVVRYCGAVPVFVDSEPDIGTMDPKAVGRAVTPKTRAIVPVHLYGHPAEMTSILEIARTARLTVIEDAAEAHGARYRGKRVGSIGNIGVFSFYGNKIMTTGEGGMVVTDDADLALRIQFLKDHAMDPDRRYWHPEVGYNYRITNLQAAIGCAQLERFEELSDKRIKVLEMYRKIFGSLTTIAFNPSRPWAQPVAWLVCGLLPNGTSMDQRDRLMKILKTKGIDSRPYFVPLSKMPPYRDCRMVGVESESLPVASDLSARGLNFPSVVRLTEQDIIRVREVVEDCL